MSKLHLVFGGRVSDPQGTDFVDLHNLDVVGLFPDYKTAEKAWRAAAQRTCCSPVQQVRQGLQQPCRASC